MGNGWRFLWGSYSQTRRAASGHQQSFDTVTGIVDNRPSSYDGNCSQPTLGSVNAMAKPILIVLLKGPFPEAFCFVETLLKPLGFLLANPDSGRITHWSDDGQQIDVSRAKIVDEASTGVMKNVQFWRSDSDDLFVSWIDASPGWEFSFHLNGVIPELKIALVTALASAILVDLKLQYEDESAFRIDFD
ncbi:hypothetical protein LGM45_21020 [Burkholderia cepacia]|uniref:hypothetical protein n=1 Tax=Burkholderia cepacia TaxID=292 RepID=UPI001CF596AF|nr:hypothetical protein [Burkholderia cepacia]MCA7931531.1 hypothetical protein [Burkholderia cepacia]